MFMLFLWNFKRSNYRYHTDNVKLRAEFSNLTSYSCCKYQWHSSWDRKLKDRRFSPTLNEFFVEVWKHFSQAPGPAHMSLRSLCWWRRVLTHGKRTLHSLHVVRASKSNCLRTFSLSSFCSSWCNFSSLIKNSISPMRVLLGFFYV